MHHICDTEITQCETEKNCVAKKKCIILVQQKKVRSFDIYNFRSDMRCIILTSHSCVTQYATNNP